MSEPEHSSVADPQEDLARTVRRSTLAMLAFWLVLMGVLYAGFTWYTQQQRASYQPYTSSTGAVVIPRAPDGHFYVDGEVNGQTVHFMVDTGASMVSVTEELAQSARLADGVPTAFSTANGQRTGRVVRDVPVRVGSLARNDIRVGVGLSSRDTRDALLGQSFLQAFDVQITQDSMTIQQRP